MLKNILSNLLVILFLGAIICGATLYSDFLKQKAFELMHVPSKKVLGVQVIGDTIDPQKKQQELSKTAQGFVHDQVDIAKQQALNIKVSDVLNTLDQSKKIVHDIQTSVQYGQTQFIALQKMLPQYKKK